MRRPPKLCACGAIVPHGTTCACQVAAKRERDHRHDAHRPTSRERGYNRRWEKARKEWLHFHPTCVQCGNEAHVVDHKIPHRGDGRLFWDGRNWQSLCKPSHDRHKQREERAAAAAEVTRV